MDDKVNFVTNGRCDVSAGFRVVQGSSHLFTEKPIFRRVGRLMTVLVTGGEEISKVGAGHEATSVAVHR